MSAGTFVEYGEPETLNLIKFFASESSTQNTCGFIGNISNANVLNAW